MDANYFTLYFLVLAGVVAVTWQLSTFRRDVRIVGMGLMVSLTLVVFGQLVPPSIDSQVNSILRTLWCVIATTVAARLISLALIGPRRWSRILLDSVAAVGLVALLGNLLVQESLWDKMDDGLDGIALWYAAILAAIVIAALWYVEKTAPRAVGALLLLFILFGGWATLRYASSLSPVQMTARGAEATQAALLQYRAENGNYPSTLTELSPRYLLLLPQPMLFRGKSWCYETQDDGYRFGYVYRPGFGARASVRVVSAKEIAPDKAWTCTEDADSHNRTAFVHE